MSGCEGYGAIASVYDKLNAELDYKSWADFFERCFEKYLNARPELILDLAYLGLFKHIGKLRALGFK